MDWRHFRIGGLASKWLIIQSPSTGPTAPNLKVCPWMDPNHALLSPNQQQDWPTMLCVWPPQRKCMAHANMPVSVDKLPAQKPSTNSAPTYHDTTHQPPCHPLSLTASNNGSLATDPP
jgi:hypothetical protein